MFRLPFVDKLKVVIDGLGAVCQRIQYDALRFLTGPYLGEDRARLERTCELLRGFVGTVDGCTVLTLGSIRECLRDPYLDGRKIFHHLRDDTTFKIRHLESELEDIRRIDREAGRFCPLGIGVYASPQERDCKIRLRKAERELSELIAAHGSIEIAKYHDELEERSKEYYDQCVKYLQARYATQPPDLTVPLPVDDGRRYRKFELESKGLKGAWLVEPELAEHEGKRILADELETIHFNVAKIAADPMCGGVRVEVLSNNNAVEDAAPHPKGDGRGRRRTYKPSPFPVVAGASISDLTIRFATVDTIDCRVRGTHRNYDFEEAGFRNRKLTNVRQAIRLWDFFAKLAELNGALAYNRGEGNLVTMLSPNRDVYGSTPDAIEDAMEEEIKEEGLSSRGIDPKSRYWQDACRVGPEAYRNLRNEVSDLREKLRLLFPQFSNEEFIEYTMIEGSVFVPGVGKLPPVWGFKTQFQLRQTYSDYQ